MFDEVHGALAAMAERVEYLGERPDLAAVYKICGNAYIIGTSALVADVFAVASAAHVASGDVRRVFEFLNPAGILAGRGKAMIERKFTPPNFELTMARKDIRLMLDTADGKPLTSLPGIAARMDALIAEQHGAEDLAVIGKDSVS